MKIRMFSLFACGVALSLASLARSAESCDALYGGFADPPVSASPQVWWHWMNGNVTKEGITADLEAFARAGIGGAQIVDVSCGIPAGPVRFGSEQWFEMLRHANEESKRLGLDLILSNCSGWSASGGPWVKAEDSMKQVVFSERIVRGGGKLPDGMPLPEAAHAHGFYRDIATLAFPRPAAEAVDPSDYGLQSTFRPGDCEAVLTFERPFPLTGVSLDFRASVPHQAAQVRVEISENGRTFRTAVPGQVVYTARYQVKGGTFFVPLPEAPVPVRAVKVVCDMTVKDVLPGPVWDGVKTVRPANAKGLASSAQKLISVRPEARALISEFQAKTFAMRAKIMGGLYSVGKGLEVNRKEILRLPGTAAGWTAPCGKDWVVVRFGYAANGMEPHPATAGGKGLEVDKLSKEAVRRFFDGYAGKAIDRLGGRSPKGGLSVIHVDSYEVGGQNWTHGFEKIFMEKKGYDIVPWLLVLTGRVVDSPAGTDRFLSDMRRVVSDLFVECYAGEMQRLCHERGLLFSLEGYGCCPCDDLRYAARCDIPMGEFWAGLAGSPYHALRIGPMDNCRFPASIAHVWGRRIAAAESFTSTGERYERDPFACKAQGDRAYCQGINRIVYHASAHQPWTGPASRPGMTMGSIGSHFETTQTWWNDGGAAWFKYQARCQWMLQEGETAADVLVFSGDDAGNYGLDLTRWQDYGKVGENAFGPGRQWDVCGGEAIIASKADGGEIVVPSGARYKAVAVLPDIVIDEKSQAALDCLAAQGVPVVPASEVDKALLKRGIGPDVVCLTKDCARDFRWIHRREKCKMESVKCKIADVKNPENSVNDVSKNGEPPSPRLWRSSRGTEWYFVALPNEKPVSMDLSFRVAGKTPEIWNPETGRISPPSFWCEENGRTRVRLDFDPSGAAFVVFKSDGTNRTCGTSKTVPDVPVVAVVPVAGPWQVSFPIGWYFGEECKMESVKCKVVEWEILKDWTSDDDPDIKYFSGTATYKCKMEMREEGRGKREEENSVNSVNHVSKNGERGMGNGERGIGNGERGGRVFLNLGEVKNIATVTVNGKTFPVLWKPPYRVDITEALGEEKNPVNPVNYVSKNGERGTGNGERGTGNGERDVFDIEIKVTNLWPNRLIGDEFLPADAPLRPKGARAKNTGVKSIPTFLREGIVPPSGRHTFSTWQHWTKEDKLLPSGILGPVRLEVIHPVSQSPGKRNG